MSVNNLIRAAKLVRQRSKRGEKMSNELLGRRDFMKGVASVAAAALPVVPAALAAEAEAAKPGAADLDSADSVTTNSGNEPWFVRADPSWVSKLSQPQYEIQFEFNMKIPMRDGVTLAANIWRHKAEGKSPIVYLQ